MPNENNSSAPLLPWPPAIDKLPETVIDAVAAALGDTYDCLRVWSAWSYGTMGPDDFRLVAEDGERTAEIARAAIEAYVAATQTVAAQPPGNEHKALAALRYYRDECSGYEPTSLSVFHRMVNEALAADVQAEPVASPAASEIAIAVCQRVAELDDRSSPEDWPEAMLVTADELRNIVLDAINDAAQAVAAQAAPAAVAYGDGFMEAINEMDGLYETEPLATPALPATEDSSAGDLAMHAAWEQHIANMGVKHHTSNNNNFFAAGFVAGRKHALASSNRPTQAEVQAEPTDAEIIDLNDGERYFSVSESRFGKDVNPHTQYHTGEPGYLQFARAVLARWGSATQAQAEVQAEPVANSDEDLTQLTIAKDALRRIASGMTVTSSDRLFDKSIKPRKMTIRDAMEIAKHQVGIVEKLIDRLYTAPQAQPADALDAGRYRWLFGARTPEQAANAEACIQNALPQDHVLSELQVFYVTKSHADGLIDAAMAAAQEGGKA